MGKPPGGSRVVYERGGHIPRRKVESAPAWSEQDRDIATAWVAYQETLCPLCGLPREVCHDPDVARTWVAEMQTCEVTALMGRARERLQAEGRHDDDVNVELHGVHGVAHRRT